MESEKREVCRKCGADPSAEAPDDRQAGANQPVRMGDMFLASRAQGLEAQAKYFMERILSYDAKSKT